MRNQKHDRLSLRVRLTILVAAELVGSILLALGLSYLLDSLVPAYHRLPTLAELILLSFLIGTVATIFLSRLFFEPIKKLCKGIEKVADGDFSVRLETRSASKEIKELYSGFNLMVQELSATEILQTDFVSNVSHEFKTPISAIEGYATLLSDCSNLEEDQRQYVEKICLNTRRLSTLVGNILLLSKIENQSIPTPPTRFRLDEQIRQSIVILEPEWEKKDIEFDVEMDRISFNGSEALMRHVWDNLIGNAIKFDPPGGLVRIRLREEPDEIRFTVEDNGPGLAPEAQKHIFDKFYQADNSHKEEGNGLGLALVKRILSIVGGRITAENRPEGGCRFTVLLKK
ncbi:MAG: ATP-binding protein [Candidatus Heritagella sp.]